MDVFPAFRRRDIPGRGRYMRLENEADTASQHSNSSRNSSSTSRRRHNNAAVLCDRCWVRHEREPASKRCLDCKQNLCIICAKCDEIRRPWWLPTLLVQCWRFLFSKAFIPHSFVELYDDDDFKQRHWVHTQEASRIQPIPRVTRDSLRSNKSTTNSGGLPEAYDNTAAQDRVERDHLVNGNALNSDNLTRSRSFEGFKERRRVRHRRSKSVDRIREKTRGNDRKEDLWNNYHIRAESYENNWDNEDLLSSANLPQKKIMKGKDIDIELTGEDVKVTVNGTDTRVNDVAESESSSKHRCAIKKTKPKKGSKKPAPEPYTERIFTDVPIWFKRPSAHKKTPISSNENQSKLSNGSESVESKANRINDDYRGYRRQNQNDISSQSKTSFNSNASKSGSTKFSSHPDKHNTHPQFTQKIDPRRHGGSPEVRHAEKGRSYGASKSYIVEEPPEQCPICLEDLPNFEARCLQCSHQIHTNCLKELLFSTDLDFGIRCPVCNQMTTVENYYAPKELWYKELPVSTSV